MFDKREEGGLTPLDETVAPQAREAGTPPPEEKKKGLVQKSVALIDSAVNSLKGQDLNRLVEDYTRDVTLVLEGLSNEVDGLKKQDEELSVRQTLAENAQQERVKALEKRMEALERALRDKQSKKQKPGAIERSLRLLLWTVGMASVSWVLVTLIRAVMK